MQENISSVKQTGFSNRDLLKSLAIVNIFETGKPFGDFAACAVLNDGAGVSYGINQFTHRSGSILAVVERYLESGGAVGRSPIEDALPLLRRREPSVIRSLAADERFKKALRAAAVTREMREAQLYVAFDRYLKPAINACAGSGFRLPLSLAVVFDGMVHGSYERLRDLVRVTASAVLSNRTPKGVTRTFEKAWITEYVRTRHRWLSSIPRLRATRYRTQFFLDQIVLGRWELDLPLNVHGFWLRDHHLQELTTYATEYFENSPVITGGPDMTAVGPNFEPKQHHTNQQSPSNAPQTPASTPQAQPPVVCHPLDGLEHSVNCAAAKFDQVDRIVTGVATRTDRAKSLWTTVIGTVWQSAWALFGILIGLPREVWLVVALIAAMLMLFYLYRQIALGKLRERA
jgi:hypothetical protein